MLIPLIGIIIPYFYIGLSMVNIGTVNIYSIDPKNLSFSFFYQVVLYTSIIGAILIIINAIIILYRLLINREKWRNIQGKYLFLAGMVLTLILQYFDPLNLLNWFFD